MNAAKRAAFAMMVKRYTKAKRATREIARETLIAEGIYTADGKLTVEYGGEKPRKRATQSKK